MKTNWTHLNPYRERRGYYATAPGQTYGKFLIPFEATVTLMVVASDGLDETYGGWEHVSVSAHAMVTLSGQPKARIPTWEEMNWIKERFWEETETVIQFHPALTEYVNCNANVLHLWRKVGENAELPPMILLAPSKEPMSPEK